MERQVTLTGKQWLLVLGAFMDCFYQPGIPENRKEVAKDCRAIRKALEIAVK